jgi:23S rRNA maturation-related 3'-5' exoribonuclease YhaM
MKQCIQQERAYHEAKIAEHRAKLEELDAKLMAMEEAAERAQADIVSQSIKGVEHDGAGDDDRWV